MESQSSKAGVIGIEKRNTGRKRKRHDLLKYRAALMRFWNMGMQSKAQKTLINAASAQTGLQMNVVMNWIDNNRQIMRKKYGIQPPMFRKQRTFKKANPSRVHTVRPRIGTVIPLTAETLQTEGTAVKTEPVDHEDGYSDAVDIPEADMSASDDEEEEAEDREESPCSLLVEEIHDLSRVTSIAEKVINAAVKKVLKSTDQRRTSNLERRGGVIRKMEIGKRNIDKSLNIRLKVAISSILPTPLLESISKAIEEQETDRSAKMCELERTTILLTNVAQDVVKMRLNFINIPAEMFLTWPKQPSFYDIELTDPEVVAVRTVDEEQTPKVHEPGTSMLSNQSESNTLQGLKGPKVQEVTVGRYVASVLFRFGPPENVKTFCVKM